MIRLHTYTDPTISRINLPLGKPILDVSLHVDPTFQSSTLWTSIHKSKSVVFIFVCVCRKSFKWWMWVSAICYLCNAPDCFSPRDRKWCRHRPRQITRRGSACSTSRVTWPSYLIPLLTIRKLSPEETDFMVLNDLDLQCHLSLFINFVCFA